VLLLSEVYSYTSVYSVLLLQAKHTHRGFVAKPPYKFIYKIYVIISLRACAGGVRYTLAPPLISLSDPALYVGKSVECCSTLLK
jgi:hypothetical protein